MQILIDIGNTSAKLALTDGCSILHAERLAEPWADALERLHSQHEITATVVSCVGSEGQRLQEALAARGETALWLSHATPCAIAGIPAGYGADRLAADIGAYRGQRALLVVDAGTCITYDLIIDGTLVGGVISPGLQLRLDAMHDHTALLPEVKAHTILGSPAAQSASDGVALMASDTQGCMLSAALHGTRFEIEGYIRALRGEYPDLEVFLTGGNSFRLAADIPYTYDPHLVLKGLMLCGQ